MDEQIKIAYEHIQKDMYHSKIEYKIAWAYLKEAQGNYLLLHRLGLEYSIHKSNMIAKFKANHKIWNYLYD